MTSRRGFLAALASVAAGAPALLAGDTDTAAAVLPVEAPDSQSSNAAQWAEGGGVASIPEEGYIPHDWRNTVIVEYAAMPWYAPG